MRRTFNHADFAQPIRYEAMTLPEDSGDAQVTATVGMMRRYALEDSWHPLVASLAQALQRACGSPQEYAQAVFQEVKRRMYFQRDEVTGASICGDDAVEVLLRPADAVLLSEGQQVPGDCDCFSMLVASLLLAGGVPCAFATAGCKASEPDAFSHVYVVAWPGTQYRVVIDVSHGGTVGWEAPNFGRYQEWPVSSWGFGGIGGLGVLVGIAAVLYYCCDWTGRDGANSFAGELA